MDEGEIAPPGSSKRSWPLFGVLVPFSPGIEAFLRSFPMGTLV